MSLFKRKRRVRVHLLEPRGVELPTVEGLLVSRRRGEYVIGVPVLLTAIGGEPAELDSRWLVIPSERVAFYELV